MSATRDNVRSHFFKASGDRLSTIFQVLDRGALPQLPRTPMLGLSILDLMWLGVSAVDGEGDDRSIAASCPNCLGWDRNLNGMGTPPLTAASALECLRSRHLSAVGKVTALPVRPSAAWTFIEAV